MPSHRTVYLIEKFGWNVFSFQPQNPVFVLSDYHLFLHLKHWLQSQCFENNYELITGVTNWLKSLLADFFDIELKTMVQ